MVAMADRGISRLRMDRAAFDGEDAVNNTLFKLFLRARDRRLGSIKSQRRLLEMVSLGSDDRNPRCARSRGVRGNGEVMGPITEIQDTNTPTRRGRRQSFHCKASDAT